MLSYRRSIAVVAAGFALAWIGACSDDETGTQTGAVGPATGPASTSVTVASTAAGTSSSSSAGGSSGEGGSGGPTGSGASGGFGGAGGMASGGFGGTGGMPIGGSAGMSMGGSAGMSMGGSAGMNMGGSAGMSMGGSAGMGMGGAGGGGGTGGGGTGGGGGGTLTLLIPDTTNDSIGKYDPVTGVYLGDFLPANQPSDPWNFQITINAVQGPNGHIYISDQLTDAVFEFDDTGAFIGTFADSTDGLDNVRGIDFLGTDLYVTVATTNSIVRFDISGNLLAPFVVDTTLDPFDVFFLADASAMVADIATDQVRHYAPGGGSFVNVTSIDFPEQIRATAGGNYLVAAFDADEIREFDATGMTLNTVSFNGPRGAYELGNGNWLASGGSGVLEIDPNSNTVVTTLKTGTGYRYVEEAILP